MFAGKRGNAAPPVITLDTAHRLKRGFQSSRSLADRRLVNGAVSDNRGRAYTRSRLSVSSGISFHARRCVIAACPLSRPVSPFRQYRTGFVRHADRKGHSQRPKNAPRSQPFRTEFASSLEDELAPRQWLADAFNRRAAYSAMSGRAVAARTPYRFPHPICATS